MDALTRMNDVTEQLSNTQEVEKQRTFAVSPQLTFLLRATQIAMFSIRTVLWGKLDSAWTTSTREPFMVLSTLSDCDVAGNRIADSRAQDG